MKNKKILIPVILFVIAVIVVVVLVARPKPAGISGSGMIEVVEIQISTKLAGQISEIRAAEASRVKAGDTLAVIDHRELAAQEKSVRAGLAIAEQSLREVEARKKEVASNRERLRSLHESGDIPDKDWESVETQYEVALTAEAKAQAGLNAARAQLELIQTQIANAYILSPVSGVVLARNFEPGEMVFPGASILKVADLKAAWLKIYVPEKRVGRVRLDAAAVVLADAYPGHQFRGKVTWIAREAEFTPKNIQVKEERSQLVFAVKIAIDNPDEMLMPGMPADAEVREAAGD
jgi:HlyD family secretion protein